MTNIVIIILTHQQHSQRITYKPTTVENLPSLARIIAPRHLVLPHRNPRDIPIGGFNMPHDRIKTGLSARSSFAAPATPSQATQSQAPAPVTPAAVAPEVVEPAVIASPEPVQVAVEEDDLPTASEPASAVEGVCAAPTGTDGAEDHVGGGGQAQPASEQGDSTI